MTTLNDFSKTDLVDDVLASYYNMLLGSIFRGDFNNSVTMSGTLTLTDADTPIQRLNCNGANRDVRVPSGASGNHPFFVINSSAGAYTLTVKSNDGATTHRAVVQGEAVLMMPDGGGTYKAIPLDIASTINQAASKSTPADADKFGFWDSVALAFKSLTWANLKANLNAVPTPEGTLINGYVSRTVASNNITVAIKTLAGTDPSTTNPVYVRIGNTVRSITAALSVTKNAATNWCNSGSAELATQEVDYFVYLGYNAALAAVVIGFSRIPWGRVYGDFSTTSTNDAYCAISNITSAASSDLYAVVGRFNAKLTGSATYQWSIPATDITINRPVTKTRWLTYSPAYSAGGSMTYTGVTTNFSLYMIEENSMYVQLNAVGTTGGTASNILKGSVPFGAITNSGMTTGAALTGGVFGGAYIATGTPSLLNIVKYDFSNFALGSVGMNTLSKFQLGA